MASTGELPCPDENALAALAARPDAAPEAQRAHVARCAACRALLQAMSVPGYSAGSATRAEPSPKAALRSDAAPAPPKSGDTVGRYVLRAELGRGGMGSVHEAIDPDLDRTIAIKLLFATSAEAEALLLREARTLARLSHPNVVVVHDVGVLADGRVFLAMEHAARGTLKDAMRSGAASRHQLLEWALAAGRGLSHAHQQGIVHRDFKPANVLLMADGTAKVSDFGLARVPLTLQDARPGTEPGTVLGTPAYMSPEQHMGVRADARSDQFALAVTLWEICAGARPFAGTTLAELRESVVRDRPPPIDARRAVPPRLESALRRALSRLPEDRFPSLDALLDEVRAAAPRASVTLTPSDDGALSSTLAAAQAPSPASSEADLPPTTERVPPRTVRKPAGPPPSPRVATAALPAPPPHARPTSTSPSPRAPARRRPHTLAVVALIAAAMAASVGVSLWLGLRTVEDTRLCKVSSSDWDEARVDRVARNFREGGRSELSDRAADLLRSRASEWTASITTTCSRAAPSSRSLTRARLRCAHVHLEAISDAARAAGDTTAASDALLEKLADLPRPEMCADDVAVAAHFSDDLSSFSGERALSALASLIGAHAIDGVSDYELERATTQAGDAKCAYCSVYVALVAAEASATRPQDLDATLARAKAAGGRALDLRSVPAAIRHGEIDDAAQTVDRHVDAATSGPWLSAAALVHARAPERLSERARAALTGMAWLGAAIPESTRDDAGKAAAALLRERGERDRAEGLARELVTAARHTFGPAHPRALHWEIALARLDLDAGRSDAALTAVTRVATAGRAARDEARCDEEKGFGARAWAARDRQALRDVAAEAEALRAVALAATGRVLESDEALANLAESRTRCAASLDTVVGAYEGVARALAGTDPARAAQAAARAVTLRLEPER